MGKNASFSDCSKSNHQSVLTAVGERAPTLHRRCYQLAKQLVGKIYNFSSFSTNCVFFPNVSFFNVKTFLASFSYNLKLNLMKIRVEVTHELNFMAVGNSLCMLKFMSAFLCLRFRLSNVFSALRAESNAIYMACMLRLSQLFVRQH